MNTCFPHRVRPVFSQEANQHPIIKQQTPTEKTNRNNLMDTRHITLFPQPSFFHERR